MPVLLATAMRSAGVPSPRRFSRLREVGAQHQGTSGSPPPAQGGGEVVGPQAGFGIADRNALVERGKVPDKSGGVVALPEHSPRSLFREHDRDSPEFHEVMSARL